MLIRCKYNRYPSDNERLWTVLSGKEVAGTYRTIIEADSHKKTLRREALMEVRVAKIKFRCPEKKIKGTAAFSIEVYAIEVKKITENINDPIHWRLLTTWPVKDFDGAQQIIEWYLPLDDRRSLQGLKKKNVTILKEVNLSKDGQ